MAIKVNFYTVNISPCMFTRLQGINDNTKNSSTPPSSLFLLPHPLSPSPLFLSLKLDWSNQATLAQLGLLFMNSTISIWYYSLLS